MRPRVTLEYFDAHLAGCGLSLEAVIVGGAALALLGVTSRQTRDCDVLQPELSATLRAAAVDFARNRRGAGEALRDDWLNNGPAQLADVLPEGWEARLRSVFEGRALRLSTLGHRDLLKTKLFALCDRGSDLTDCLALAPSADELTEAAVWTMEQDTNPLWPEHVRQTLKDLGRRLGHGL